jgi:hypothetical protein
MGLFSRRPHRNSFAAKLVGMVVAGVASVITSNSVGLYTGIGIAIIALLFAYEALSIRVKNRAIYTWERIIFLALYFLFILLAIFLGEL